MLHEKTFAFVGSGNMAGALLSGLVQPAGNVPADHIWTADIDPQRLRTLHEQYGIHTSSSNREVVQQADVVILAVKPQVFPTILQEIAVDVTANKLVISIAAGIALAKIQHHLPPTTRVIRTMPNVAALIHAAVTALSRGPHATADDLLLAEEIFKSVGETVVVDEKLMDAVTGLSGSGPGYIFYAIYALADGGVKVGLPRETALKLAAHTVYGAAKMLIETGDHPMKLRDLVTSPGGTTIAGLHALERDGFAAALMNAVETSTCRAKELGQS